MTLALIVTALYFITAGLLVGLSRPLLTEAGIGNRDTVATLAVLILMGRAPSHSATMAKWSRFSRVWGRVFRAALMACFVVEAMQPGSTLPFWGLVLWMILLTMLLVYFLSRTIPHLPKIHTS
jgi:hypothetical protein